MVLHAKSARCPCAKLDYRETCELGSIADAACLPCSKPDWKANTRLTVSEVFNTDSCGHTCNAGFFKTALMYNVTNGFRVKTETRMEFHFVVLLATLRRVRSASEICPHVQICATPSACHALVRAQDLAI
jgi:hypothetical protein